MKHILLIRHGNAVPPGGRLDDFDRPLSSRGRRETADAAAWSLEKFRDHRMGAPGVIYTSPALRTRETAEIAAGAWGLDSKNIRHPGSLYLPGPQEILEILWQQPEDLSFIVICSHNPGLTLLGSYLFAGIPDGLAPAGIMLGCFDVSSWPEVQKNRGTLLEFRNPSS